MTTEEIFKEILGHMLKGMMVHEQFANYYDFLGLDGYRQCHEYHFIDESCNYRNMYHYYIETYDKLLPQLDFSNPLIIPQSWIKYTRQDVDINTKQSAIEKGLMEWIKWESDTLELYQKHYQELMKLGEVAAAAHLLDIIKDVQEELQTAKQYHLNKLSTDYDMTLVIEEQKKKKKEFKDKITKHYCYIL